MLRHVIKWTNGMVMAFDEHGQQIPELQGTFEEVRDKVLAARTSETTFEGGDWGVKETWESTCTTDASDNLGLLLDIEGAKSLVRSFATPAPQAETEK